MDEHISPLEFTCFPQLPAEIRCEIWKLTILPRIVDIHVHNIGSLKSGGFKIDELYSTTPVPTILQVCQESRAVGLMTYRLCFSTSLIKANRKAMDFFMFTRSPSTYFSYELDTANFKSTEDVSFFWRNAPTRYLTDRDLSNIRHIRVNWPINACEGLIRSMASFKALETFTFSWFWQDDDPEDHVHGINFLNDEEGDVEVFAVPHCPNVHRFISSLKVARDIFVPGYKFPLLVVKSLNERHINRDSFATFIINLNLNMMQIGLVAPRA